MSFPKFKESLKPQIDSKSEVTPDTDLLLIQVAHQKDEENNRHKIKIYALRLFAGLGGTMIIVYIYHLLMPSWARWLSPSEMAAIKDLALSIMTGVSVSLAIKFTTKYLNYGMPAH